MIPEGSITISCFCIFLYMDDILAFKVYWSTLILTDLFDTKLQDMENNIINCLLRKTVSLIIYRPEKVCSSED